ncbi:bifunctional adenosylcobinamide kinase/adenosylcobinamide-phosphate guanylyltransferase [Actinophytocola xanthii]|uniref:Adenosylcobinamide kinase n=1 Tax=Actinophytocola xanthii TaxID=1912961 RepID=A0A1Q8CRH7_9PSEU|nr:bifunctional adenosylcobinamide kinase/adenosylcobinamide-phosphate guanylyltransferase [Actinophytocola xanthii]OLF16955.1 bifunctional adenosylcobinamide kinase/adenosylcobinamide-phosphate guanylyltransferase [Actinophytocola xanthii]
MATLVLGGARSGKSAHAEGLLPADRATYVATARTDPADAEWQARIDAHAARRPPGWRTVELAAPAELPELLAAAGSADPPILVDDLATWLTTLLDDTGAWQGAPRDPVRAEYARLVDAAASCRAELVLVSAEVGLGVVPATPAGRLFRDELGTLNADLATRCSAVVLLVAGIPLRLR